MGLKENYKNIKEQIGNYSVRLIAVTKYATSDQILEAYKIGINNFGENYVQDALKKLDTFSEKDHSIIWHFIGRLQKNKVKYIVGRFHIIHSVDSIELAELIDKKSEECGVNQNILLQVNISGEESKAGFTSKELIYSFSRIKELKSIKVKGLMTMAPFTSNKEIKKECFLTLKNLRDEVNSTFNAGLDELSMGMSNDYVTAIDCGSTMIRVGKALFGS